MFSEYIASVRVCNNSRHSSSPCQNTDWNKYDDRLMKAVERGEVEKVAAVLTKKGVIPTKLDVEGRSA